MKDKCDCGTPLDTIRGNGYIFTACPKGHYERHEATGTKLKHSDWVKDMMGWEPAPEPLPRPGTSIASALVHDTLLWADKELAALQRAFPDTDLRLPSWYDGQGELQKLTASSGVLEIKDAIEKYKQRVNVYLSKWRKKLQSRSPK